MAFCHPKDGDRLLFLRSNQICSEMYCAYVMNAYSETLGECVAGLVGLLQHIVHKISDVAMTNLQGGGDIHN